MKNKIIVGLGIILLVVGYLYWGLKNEKEIKEIENIELKEGEQEKTIFDPVRRTLTRIRKDRSIRGSSRNNEEKEKFSGSAPSLRVTRIRGVRRAAIIFREDSSIDVKAVNKGPTLTFGPTLFYTEDRMFGGVDAEVFYWQNVSLSVGGGLAFQDVKKFRGYGALGYTPRFRFMSNTKFDIGFTTGKEFKLGVSWRF